MNAQSFFRNTKRWGKFEFRRILLPKFELTFLTAVGNISVETGDEQWELYVDEIRVEQWELYVDEIQVSNYNDPYSSYLRYEPLKLMTSAPDDLPRLYRSALKSVNEQIKYWKEEHGHWQALINAAEPACAKCQHCRKNLPSVFSSPPHLGPLTSAYMTSSQGYMCHRYPVAVPVTALHKCGEFQEK